MEKSCLYESDFSCYKPRADLVLSGTCHAPGRQPVKGCRVTFQVGQHKKSLFVFGDRQWRQNPAGGWTISEPDPFTELPLIHENSFGGPAFADNPHGKGFGSVTNAAGQRFMPLPNIEDPGALLVSPDSRPVPAGFAPRGRMWPRRTTGKVGTYDEAWLKERWPYFPADFDWGYFNCAQPDMQVEGYLTGNETLYFENLHPRYPQYHGQLPCVRTRLFVTQVQGATSCFREVKLNLDTLWVNPETEKLILVWRGVIEVSDEEMTDIAQCLVVSEPFAANPEPIDHYQALLLQRLREEQEDDVEEEQVIEAPSVDDVWVGEMEADFARMEEEFKQIEAQADEAEKTVRKMLAEAGVDPAELDRAQKAANQMSLKDVLAQSAKQEHQVRTAHPELAKNMPPPMTAEELNELEQSFFKEPMDEFEPLPIPLTREACEERLAAQESFAHADLAGLDLSGLDFSGCSCSQANFSGALLQGTRFTAADLSGANLAGCDLSAVDFQGASLAGADCTGATLNFAVLDGAVLDDTDFSAASLERVSCNNVHGFRVIFVGAHLPGARFLDAVMQEADFEQANLEQADFTRANLQEASVEGVKGKAITMQSANLTGLHASECPDFTEGNFRGVSATESIWEGAILERADFSGATLVNADFAQSSLRQARFSGADLTWARFEKADLADTNMAYVNLFRGSMEKAKLLRTDLRGANCYEVEFYLAEINGARFDGANLKMTKLAVQS